MKKTSVSVHFAKSIYLIFAVVCAAMILTACASPAAAPVDPVVPTAAPQATAEATAQPAAAQPAEATAVPASLPEAVLNIATDPTLGQILVGENGMTLYMFTKDTADTSNCNASCLKKWPALITQGSPVLGEGVDASLVGSATLADGSKIVTYNHMPLYYWYEDFKAGDTNGQGVGDVWYVVAPDGNPVGLTSANANDNGNGNANANDNGNANDNQNTNDDYGNNNGGG